MKRPVDLDDRVPSVPKCTAAETCRLVLRQRGRGPFTTDDCHFLHDTHGLPCDLIDYLIER